MTLWLNFFNIIQMDFKFKMVKNTSNCQFTVNVRKIETESGSVAYTQQLKYSVSFGAINVPEANVRKPMHTVSELTTSK